MQNTGFRVFRGFAGRYACLSAFFCLCVCLCAMAVFAPSASAASYSCTSVSIKAEATSAADLVVSETRRFEFASAASYLSWGIDNPTTNGEVAIDGVTVRRYAEGSASKVASRTRLKETPFQAGYPKDTRPSDNTFAVDPATERLYLFFDADSEVVEVTVRYVIANGLSCYKDVAQVFWRYVPENWDVASQDVVAKFKLPVPPGEKVVESENVFAWGHGPLDGEVSFTSKGVVVCKAAQVNAGQFAEVRIIFPIEWVPNRSESSEALHENVAYRDSAIKSELDWADQANWLQVQSTILVAFAFVLAIIMLLWGAWAFRRWSRDPEPSRLTSPATTPAAGSQRLELPLPGEDPVLVSRLCRWGKPDRDELSLVLASLVAKGAVRVFKGSSKVGNRSYEGLYLVRSDASLANRVSPAGSAGPASSAGAASEAGCADLTQLEQMVLDHLFTTIASNGRSLWLDQVAVFNERSPQVSQAFRSSFHEAVSQRVTASQLFDGRSQRRKALMRGISVAYLAFSVVYSVEIASPIPLVGVLVSFALILMSHFIERRTQKGSDAFAMAEALRSKLENLSDADLVPGSELPASADAWSQLLVVAAALDVAMPALAGARSRAPWLFDGAQEETDGSHDASDTPDTVVASDGSNTFTMLAMLVEERSRR